MCYSSPFQLSLDYSVITFLTCPQNLNFTGFRKILKKHDKILDTSRGADWRVVQVEVAPFYTCKKITQLISETEVCVHMNLNTHLFAETCSAAWTNSCICGFRRLLPQNWRGAIVKGPWRGWEFLHWGQLRSATTPSCIHVLKFMLYFLKFMWNKSVKIISQCNDKEHYIFWTYQKYKQQIYILTISVIVQRLILKRLHR